MRRELARTLKGRQFFLRGLKIARMVRGPPFPFTYEIGLKMARTMRGKVFGFRGRMMRMIRKKKKCRAEIPFLAFICAIRVIRGQVRFRRSPRITRISRMVRMCEGTRQPSKARQSRSVQVSPSKKICAVKVD
jgi:hypothetical protein